MDKILKTIKTSQQINSNNKTKQEKEQSWEDTAGDNIYPTTPNIIATVVATVLSQVDRDSRIQSYKGTGYFQILIVAAPLVLLSSRKTRFAADG